jgi:hypothetical protein
MYRARSPASVTSRHIVELAVLCLDSPDCGGQGPAQRGGGSPITTKHAALGLALALGLTAWSAAAANAPLAKAVRQGADKSIAKLIAAGESINEVDDQGRGPLYYACARGDADLITQLVAKGAQLDVQDKDGDTPLMVLVRNTFEVGPQAQFLTSHGANLNAQNHAGRTALMEAILRSPGVLDFRSQTALVKSLLDAGADAGLLDADGAEAAHHAAAVGEPLSMFKAVLTKTADPGWRRRDGLDVLGVAVQHAHPVIARQMFQLGYAPTHAPPASAAGIANDPTRLDDHPRINAVALTWFGDYLAQQGHAADALEAYGHALTFYDDAIKEQERTAEAVQHLLAEDERKRDNARAGTFALNVAGVALAAATGTGAIFILTPNATVEADKQRLKTLEADEADLRRQRDAVKQKPTG